MPKTLIIAEKPSLAREIKDMLSESFAVKWTTGKDYSESSEYYLSSFFGHLLEAVAPEDYDPKYKEWRMEDLPILPDRLKFQYKGDAKARGKLLAGLAAKSENLVCATDPDREGEGIFRIWYNAEGIKKPFGRLWATSLALADLTKAWKGIKPSQSYDTLAAAQYARQEADWLVGMNGSRAYAISSGERISVGRVQTATLALVVKRDAEVEGFKKSFLYSVTGNWCSLPVTYFEESGTRFEDQVKMAGIANTCKHAKFSLKAFTKESKKQNPPKTFSMPDLQKEANRKFGFALDKTLELAQSLYERKLTTYPRTDSPYLPPADLDKYYQILDKLAVPRQKAILKPKGEAVPSVKSTEAPHTAVIPTGIEPGGLSPDEDKLYGLILDRFICAFMQPREYDEYTVVVCDGSHNFRSRTFKTIKRGFTELSAPEASDEKDDRGEELRETDAPVNEADLKGREEKIENLRLVESERKKPSYYTPATLLSAMINVGRTVDSKEDQEILKEVEGLGTAATRDKFPVELERRGYIAKSGKYLVSTVKGRQLIGWVAEELKSPVMTAQWERKLREIEGGTYPLASFRTAIREFVTQIVKIDKGAAQTFKAALDEDKQKCPRCGKPMRENAGGFFCDDFKLFTTIAGKKLSPKVIAELLEHKKTGIIDGFKKKDGGGTYAARLVISENWEVKMSFDMTVDYKCPSCGKDVKSAFGGYSCADPACGFKIYPIVSEKKLTDAQMLQLLTKGKTGTIRGFVSAKNGRPFEAALAVDKEKRRVIFRFEDKKQ